jgi:hypothetical protein
MIARTQFDRSTRIRTEDYVPDSLVAESVA